MLNAMISYCTRHIVYHHIHIVPAITILHLLGFIEVPVSLYWNCWLNFVSLFDSLHSLCCFPNIAMFQCRPQKCIFFFLDIMSRWQGCQFVSVSQQNWIFMCECATNKVKSENILRHYLSRVSLSKTHLLCFTRTVLVWIDQICST